MLKILRWSIVLCLAYGALFFMVLMDAVYGMAIMFYLTILLGWIGINALCAVVTGFYYIGNRLSYHIYDVVLWALSILALVGIFYNNAWLPR